MSERFKLPHSVGLIGLVYLGRYRQTLKSMSDALLRIKTALPVSAYLIAYKDMTVLAEGVSQLNDELEAIERKMKECV
jgi:hypothetical protein